MDGQKIWVNQIGWSHDGSGDIEYKGGKLEEFKFKKVTELENTVTLELENNLLLRLNRYEDQEAAKLKVLREYQ